MLNNIFKYLNLSNDYDLIIPHIYIGNSNSSLNKNFIEKKNIKLIVNCTKDLKFIKSENLEKVRIPIDDNRIFKNNDILKYLDVLNTIHDYREKKENILIHCRVGSQRSATIILLYLIKKLNYSYNEGYNILKIKRPICFCPFNNFFHVFCEDNSDLTLS